MAKELPYFKFEPSEWDNGNIQMCCLNTRAIFIDLCCIYWTRVGDLPYALALQKICGGNEEALDERIGEWTIRHSPKEVMEMMQAAGVAAGVVKTTEDLLEHDPQLKHRHFYWELDHPEIEKYRSPRSSILLSKSPCELKRAPLLSEHNGYALKEILGMSDDDIAELLIEGVVE